MSENDHKLHSMKYDKLVKTICMCAPIYPYFKSLFIFIWKRDRKIPGMAGHHGYNSGAGKSEQMDLPLLARLESIPRL